MGSTEDAADGADGNNVACVMEAEDEGPENAAAEDVGYVGSVEDYMHQPYLTRRVWYDAQGATN